MQDERKLSQVVRIQYAVKVRPRPIRLRFETRLLLNLHRRLADGNRKTVGADDPVRRSAGILQKTTREKKKGRKSTDGRVVQLKGTAACVFTVRVARKTDKATTERWRRASLVFASPPTGHQSTAAAAERSTCCFASARPISPSQLSAAKG